jgi:hypothetical protein
VLSLNKCRYQLTILQTPRKGQRMLRKPTRHTSSSGNSYYKRSRLAAANTIVVLPSKARYKNLPPLSRQALDRSFLSKNACHYLPLEWDGAPTPVIINRKVKASQIIAALALDKHCTANHTTQKSSPAAGKTEILEHSPNQGTLVNMIRSSTNFLRSNHSKS